MKYTDEDMLKHTIEKHENKEQCLMCKDDTNFYDYQTKDWFCSIECKTKFYQVLVRTFEK